MPEAVIATRRMLVSEIDVPGSGPLILTRPVLIEAGQRYWVNTAESALVVETAGQEPRLFRGDFYGPVLAIPRRFTALICVRDGEGVERMVERVDIVADSMDSARTTLEAQHGVGSVYLLHDVEAGNRLRSSP